MVFCLHSQWSLPSFWKVAEYGRNGDLASAVNHCPKLCGGRGLSETQFIWFALWRCNPEFLSPFTDFHSNKRIHTCIHIRWQWVKRYEKDWIKTEAWKGKTYKLKIKKTLEKRMTFEKPNPLRLRERELLPLYSLSKHEPKATSFKAQHHKNP